MYVCIQGPDRLNSEETVVPQCVHTHDAIARAHPSSPSWHRRCRLRRAKARLRVRTALVHSRPPAASDLFLLESHHTRPVYRRVMGWASWEKGGRGGKDSGRGVWRGAWPQRQPKDKPLDARFPSYESVALPKGKGKNSERKPDEGWMDDTEEDLVSTIQEGVNAACKAEQRVRQLTNNRVKEESQWAAYLEATRKTYLKEADRCNKEISRLGDELQVALQLQVARDKLRSMHLGEPTSSAIEGDGEWDQMMQAWRQERQEEVANAAGSAGRGKWHPRPHRRRGHRQSRQTGPRRSRSSPRRSEIFSDSVEFRWMHHQPCSPRKAGQPGQTREAGDGGQHTMLCPRPRRLQWCARRAIRLDTWTRADRRRGRSRLRRQSNHRRRYSGWRRLDRWSQQQMETSRRDDQSRPDRKVLSRRRRRRHTSWRRSWKRSERRSSPISWLHLEERRPQYRRRPRS